MSESLPRLLGYHAALDRYKSTAPLRSGTLKGQVPLGDKRRYTRSRIEASDGEVRLIFHSSPLIVFYEDSDANVIRVSNGGWDSPSTLGFLRDVYGEKSFTRKSGKIYFTTQDGAHYRLSKQGITIRNGHPIDAKPESTVVLNVAKLRELRKRYAPFITYCTNICKISSNTFSEDWYAAVGSSFYKVHTTYDGKQIVHGDPNKPRLYQITSDKWDRKRERQRVWLEYCYLFSDIDRSIKTNDLDLMYLRYLNIFEYYKRSNYNRNLGKYVFEFDTKRLKKAFDELFKFRFSDYLFERKEAELGVIYSHHNERYVEAETE